MEYKEKIKEIMVEGNLQLGITLAQGQGCNDTELIELVQLVLEELNYKFHNYHATCWNKQLKRFSITGTYIFIIEVQTILSELLEKRQEELEIYGCK